MLVDTLVADGFTDPSRVVIQSFEVANPIDLQTRIMPAAGIDVQLVQLLNEGGYDIAFFDPAKAGLGADPGAYGALDYPITAESVSNNDLYNPAALQAMHALYAEAIGPYKDDILPAAAISPPVDGDGDGVALIAAGVDGFFTDFPGTGRQVVDQLKAEALPQPEQGGGAWFDEAGRPAGLLSIPIP